MTHSTLRMGRVLLPIFALLLPFFADAQLFNGFPKGVRLFEKGDFDRAKPIFKKYEHDPKKWPGAVFYLEQINANRTTLEQCRKSDSLLCAAANALEGLSPKLKQKLEHCKVTEKRITSYRKSVEETAIALVRPLCSVSALDSLLDFFPCWLPDLDKLRDSARREVVNCYINRNAQIGTQHFPDANGKIRRDSLWPDYDALTSIINCHEEFVLEDNFDAYGEMRDSIWEHFERKYSYCAMDKFRDDHPLHTYSQDCWFDDVRDVLCRGDLHEMLAFHDKNTATVLEHELIEVVDLLARNPLAYAGLSVEEQQRAKDFSLLWDLHQAMFQCKTPLPDTAQLLRDTRHYGKKHAPRFSAFQVVQVMTDALLWNGHIVAARAFLREMQPFFRDSMSCPSAPLPFQVGKQAWFKKHANLLGNDTAAVYQKSSMAAWNTSDNWEHSAVTWGDGSEVFFARENRRARQSSVMVSRLGADGWSKPVPVPGLSAKGRAVPLSITQNGLTMLLRAGRDLCIANRFGPNLHWLPPMAIKSPLPFFSSASLSPDGRSLLIAGSTATATAAGGAPSTGIFKCEMLPNGSFGPPMLLSDSINAPESSTGNPILVAEGRTLLFVSDRKGGFGYADVYSASRKNPDDWKAWQTPKNLGWELSSLFDEGGISYAQPFGGGLYFTRISPCPHNYDRDIWRAQLPDTVDSPQGIRRLHVIARDENNRSLTGGFVEIMLNYNEKPLSVPLDAGGNAWFQLPDTAAVARLYVEVPGHYSWYDSVHFLQALRPCQIIHDTFRLESFEHIRKNFNLRYATFDYNKGAFNDPRVFAELDRLADVAHRMGAVLTLVGNTDSIGTRAQNEKIALERVLAVKQYLVEHCAMLSAKVSVVSQGASRPKCSNASEEGRQCNRRVEVIFEMPKLAPSIKKVPVDKKETTDKSSASPTKTGKKK